jgi:hypothetical protein
MSQPRRVRSRLLTINRPAWQANLPRGLRIAAEWQFGTLIVASLLGAVRTGDYATTPIGIFTSIIFFLILSGWAENKRINNKVAWWALSIGLGLGGALAIAVLVFDPPQY